MRFRPWTPRGVRNNAEPLDGTKWRPRDFQLTHGLIDMVTAAKMKSASEHGERAGCFTEWDVGPVEPDLSIDHVDAEARIGMSKRVMRKVKISRVELRCRTS